MERQREDKSGSEPHSGAVFKAKAANPTVWDRREACGNVDYGGG